jgi:hypothetical protein
VWSGRNFAPNAAKAPRRTTREPKAAKKEVAWWQANKLGK